MVKQSDKFIYQKQADILKALAHPVRVGVLEFLKDGPKCVCEIAEYIGAERSNVSRHLAVMSNAGILSYEKKGLEVIYKIRFRCALKFLSCVKQCLKALAKENDRVLRAV